MRRVGTILKYNIRLTISYNVVTSVGIMILTVLIVGVRGFNLSTYLRISDQFLIFMGPASVLGIADLECREQVWEYIYNKGMSVLPIIGFRLLFLFLTNAIIVLVPYLIMTISTGKSGLDEYYWGSCITVTWFALLCFFIVEISGSRQTAFCILVVYYLTELFTEGKITGDLQLMGYMFGNIESKKNLLILSVVLLMAIFIFEEIKIRGKYDDRDRITQ